MDKGPNESLTEVKLHHKIIGPLSMQQKKRHPPGKTCLWWQARLGEKHLSPVWEILLLGIVRANDRQSWVRYFINISVCVCVCVCNFRTGSQSETLMVNSHVISIRECAVTRVRIGHTPEMTGGRLWESQLYVHPSQRLFSHQCEPWGRNLWKNLNDNYSTN